MSQFFSILEKERSSWDTEDRLARKLVLTVFWQKLVLTVTLLVFALIADRKYQVFVRVVESWTDTDPRL